MRRVLSFFLWGSVVVLVLGAYFVYSPAPARPLLSGKITKSSIDVGGLTRTYLIYVPQPFPKGAPLVLVMHGSGENGAQMRIATGYAFERLADEHGFAVVYPDGYQGYWNACNIIGDYSANKLNIDDVGFLTALADKLVTELAVDPRRVFAAGMSRGGHMAFRLALEASSRFRAVAAIAASVPTPDNFKCKPAAQGTSSVLIMNGTKDPLNPFNGGNANLFGFMSRGKVRSSRESGQYFADLNHIGSPPQASQLPAADGVRVEQLLWRNATDNYSVEVELVAIHGGGHVIPQPYWRFPRLLGPTPKEPNGPALIWTFFNRQQPR